MIGLFGIIANEEFLDKNKRLEAFSLMSNDINHDDFYNQYIYGKNFSIGLTFRKIGENKDLALKQIDNDFVIAFSGYGKFLGEKHLCWAEEMIEKISPFLKGHAENILTKIEGSFLCLVFCDNKLLIISDRLGSKNLYYYDNNNGLFIFAPDVGRVLGSCMLVRKKNIKSATQVLLTGFFLGDETLAENVLFFPAGSILKKYTDKNYKIEFNKYWNIPLREGTVDKIDSALIEEFDNKMSQSIYELAELEDRSVIPLSGGLDSRAIACFLAKRQEINTITYGMGDETGVAKKVCNILGGEATYFDKKKLESNYFKKAIYDSIKEQKIHSVLNQYFYAPLFKQYFKEHDESVAIYDGVYMDILLSGAPCIYKHFDFDRFLKRYAGGLDLTSKMSYSLNETSLYSLMEDKYNSIQKELNNGDGVGESQLFYATGRLRRYVNQSPSAKENYCYVFRPGYNYDLMDFGYSLNLKVRKGLLYTTLLNKEFPEVMRIRYKDSYGNRAKTFDEKIFEKYKRLRLKLSSATHGIINYTTFQVGYFFLEQKNINDYKNLFTGRNCISEIFIDSQMTKLFHNTKKKHYLFNSFDRVLFLQQFYAKYNF